MADKKDEPKFDLLADPFDTGFEAKLNITTDDVVRFVAARRSFLPKDEPLNDPAWWKASAKAAIQGGWFTVPDWKTSDVGKWPLAKTRWLSQWTTAKYEEMADIPFGN